MREWVKVTSGSTCAARARCSQSSSSARCQSVFSASHGTVRRARRMPRSWKRGSVNISVFWSPMPMRTGAPCLTVAEAGAGSAAMKARATAMTAATGTAPEDRTPCRRHFSVPLVAPFARRAAARLDVHALVAAGDLAVAGTNELDVDEAGLHGVLLALLVGCAGPTARSGEADLRSRAVAPAILSVG